MEITKQGTQVSVGISVEIEFSENADDMQVEQMHDMAALLTAVLQAEVERSKLLTAVFGPLQPNYTARITNPLPVDRMQTLDNAMPHFDITDETKGQHTNA